MTSATYAWTKAKKVSERHWYLPSTTRRQVTRNALNNSGDGALTMVPLCRELSGTGDHTRKTMEVKRTSWANYGRYRRSYILLVSTAWLILQSSTMTQKVTRPMLLLALLLWWVMRTHHYWLTSGASWLIPNTTRSHADSYCSIPFHSLLSNQKMNVPLSTYGKILSGSRVL